MKERTRKIFIMIVMAALIVSLTAASFAALTYGRYTGGKLDEDSPYEDYIDFVGATAFEVTSPDAFINAINNGYSYIKIADDAEEPFVINNNVADVYTNLVLDVNGHVVVRNSRNPLLDVRRSISVVLVYDSSTEADGGFYNPVGSSLQTSGGTLTVGEGVYESGPNVEAAQSVTTAEISDVFVRDGDRASATKYQKATAAAQLPKPGKDVYLDETYSGTKNDYLKADTYLLYTVEKNGYEENDQLYVNAKKNDGGTLITAEEFSPICNVASCDFYYYYPVDADGSPINTEGTQDTPQTYAVIYGYNDVKALASNKDQSAEMLQKSGLVWPYAAIRSVEDPETQEGGVTHARGGAFKTHFGKENTYCIYSAGGTMTVGTSGSAGGPAFEAVGSGVCIAMTDGSENASEGVGGSLTISGGTFSSRLGNTIEMENGNMTVTAGAFTKTGCKKGTGDKQLENQTAIISLTGGTLNVSGTKTGDTYSVTMTAGGAGNGGTLENVFGIRADDGGEISTKGVSFHIYGDYSAGVLSYDGKIDLGNDTAITVTQSNEKQDGDHILLTSAGVSSEQASEGEEHPVNLSGNVTIASNGLGITARGAVNVTEGTTTVTTPRGTGIYVNGGTFRVESDATISVTSTVWAGYAWGLPPEGQGTAPNIYNGVYVQGGSLISNGTLNVTFTGVQNVSQYSLEGILPPGVELPAVGDEGKKSISGTFEDSDNSDWYTAWKNFNDTSNNTPSFRDLQAQSYAIRVDGDSNTKVTVEDGDITSSVGGGIYIGGGGTVVLGESVSRAPKIHADGADTITTSYIYSFTREVEDRWVLPDIYKYTIEVREAMPFSELSNSAQNWAYRETKTGGDAVRMEGGTLTIHGGEYISKQGNGIVTVGGTTTIHQGKFLGADTYRVQDNNSKTVPAGPAASYAFKVYGGTITVNDGTFGNTTSSASGGFVMGTSTQQGTAYIYGGDFVVGAQGEDGTAGQAGFGVYNYANVTFGRTGDPNANINVTGLAAGLVLEQTNGNSGTSVTINSGTFSSSRTGEGSSDGVWYGNNTSRLEITGGQFTGVSRSGLYFQKNSWNETIGNGNVQISGGTFVGNSTYHWNGGRPYWVNGAIGADSSGLDSGLGHDIQIQDIIVCSEGKYIEYYSNATDTAFDSRVELSNYQGADRDDQKINQTTCHYNKVIIY